MEFKDLLLQIPPWVYLGTTLALIVSLLFYALFGHRQRSPLLYLPAGIAGFFVGNWAGNAIGLATLQLGDVQALAAIAGSLLILILVHLIVT